MATGGLRLFDSDAWALIFASAARPLIEDSPAKAATTMVAGSVVDLSSAFHAQLGSRTALPRPWAELRRVHQPLPYLSP